MPKIKKLAIFFSIFLMLLMPAVSFAQTTWKGLVPCSNTSTVKEGIVTPAKPTVREGIVTPAKPCDFVAFMALIDTIIKFILFYLAVPIAAIMFAYAGFKLVTAGGAAAEARTKAKSIFTSAVIGLALAAGAYLIVKTILSILGYEGGWIGF